MHNGQHPETPSPPPLSPGNVIIQSASPLLNYLVALKLKLSKGEQISPDVLRNDAKALLSDVEK
ncbi:MAG: hypothetical protein MI799_22455, partial [Desulfobacterales bacterium]|nr:hypothetical protein [Desulfobacterales bacterium]